MNNQDKLSAADVALGSAIFRAFREHTVNALLSGNDTGCFTEDQYREEYIMANSWNRLGEDIMRKLWTPDRSAMHLRSLPDLVREVRPGVWAAVETLEFS